LRGVLGKLRFTFSEKICVSNFNALKGFKDLEAFASVRRKQLQSPCSVFSYAFAGALCLEMLDVKVVFLVLCGGFLTIHFNLITIRDELLLC